MSRLLEITRQIQDTESTMAQAQKRMLENNPTPSILAAFESLEKRRDNLDLQFEEAANAEQLDVCDYRVFYDDNEDEKPTLRVFSRTLLDFQNLFTQVFRSVTTNTAPKDRRVQADIIQQTNFGVHYTFQGSLGVVLTLPNEALLFESDIDRSVQVIAELAKLTESDDIARYAQKYGVATIRSLYDWTADQVKAGVGSEIHWKKGTDIKVRSLAEFDELVALKEAIESTSDKSERTITVRGTLVGVDVPARTFHMSFDEGRDVRGKFEENLDRFHYRIPRIYTATITETKTVFYSTDEEKTSFLLTDLREEKQLK